MGWFFFFLCATCLAALSAAAQTTGSAWLVVERGGQRATVRQGLELRIEQSIEPSAPIVGMPRLSPSHPLLYVATSDSAIAAFDLAQGRWTARLDLGAVVTALAISGNGQWLALATAAPPTLHLLDATLKPHARHASATLDGKTASRITSIEDAPQRHSFIIGQADMRELWEVSYDPQAKPIYDGLVHDFRMSESIAKPGFLGVRRTPLDETLDLVAYDPPHRHVIGVSRRPPIDAGAPLQIINLDIRRRIVQAPVAPQNTPGARADVLLAAPHPGMDGMPWIDPKGWRVERVIEAAPWWGSSPVQMTGPHWWLPTLDGTSLALFDGQTLQRKATLALPGKPLALAPSADGGQVAVLTAGAAGAAGTLALYDSRSLARLATQPVDGPVTVLALP